MQLRVCSDTAALETARLAMLAFLEGKGLSPRVVFRLELILEETLMNLIWHAYPQGEARPIDIGMALDAEQIVLCFEDDGIPFDPEQAPARVAPKTLTEATPGGLGLLLTRKSARRVLHERVNDRNRLTIEVARLPETL